MINDVSKAEDATIDKRSAATDRAVTVNYDPVSKRAEPATDDAGPGREGFAKGDRWRLWADLEINRVRIELFAGPYSELWAELLGRDFSTALAAALRLLREEQ